MKQALRSRSLPILLLASLLLTGSIAGAAGKRNGGDDDDGGGTGHDSLTLRVNDAIGVPGGVVAVVLRTYAPRPVRQGQISIRVVRRPRPAKLGLTVEELTQPARPLTLLSAVVYSTRNDSAAQAVLSGLADSQLAKVQFQSPSGTVNASDGPLAVLRFRLDPSVAPGQTYDLSFDSAVTSLTDGSGQPVTLDPRPGTLTVRAPSAPFLVEAEGDEVEPGETAELGVETYEPFQVSGGRITLRYALRVAGGPPVVRLDPRYGRASFTVNTSQPGRLVVDFKSPDSSFNTVPGSIIGVTLPISGAAAIGANTKVTLDPAGTWLLNRKGKKIKLRLEGGDLEVR